jgi:uncharacterized protein (DUF2235 family)
MGKTIVFCADGTWNNPKQDENHDRSADPTNVFKTFQRMRGALLPEPTVEDKTVEQEKMLSVDGNIAQVAKYLHGVGDSKNAAVKLLGGAFGAGVIARVVRGYTFVSRHYRPGDDVVIIGFSRGAYTARALAGLICSQGLLRQDPPMDKETAYTKGGQAWFRWRHAVASKDGSTHLASIAAHLAEIVLHPIEALTRKEMTAGELAPVDRVAAVGVWDTVGAMGLPEFKSGHRVDAFKFANRTLHPKVARGFHAVALDEMREDFTPTLWEPSDRLEQVLFPGSHSDVGGGYPAKDRESGTSDGALAWMVARLAEVGVRFDDAAPKIVPDAAGTMHKPWSVDPWTEPVFPKGTRKFPKGMREDPSIAARVAAADVVANPGEAAAPYRPTNRP